MPEFITVFYAESVRIYHCVLWRKCPNLSLYSLQKDARIYHSVLFSAKIRLNLSLCPLQKDAWIYHCVLCRKMPEFITVFSAKRCLNLSLCSLQKVPEFITVFSVERRMNLPLCSVLCKNMPEFIIVSSAERCLNFCARGTPHHSPTTTTTTTTTTHCSCSPFRWRWSLWRNCTWRNSRHKRSACRGRGRSPRHTARPLACCAELQHHRTVNWTHGVLNRCWNCNTTERWTELRAF